jgi:hypothetical protein
MSKYLAVAAIAALLVLSAIGGVAARNTGAKTLSANGFAPYPPPPAHVS